MTSNEIKFSGSEFTGGFHPALGQFGLAADGEATETLTAHKVSPHSQGELLPSFVVSAVSGCPSVLLPLSEAAEYLSESSTCQQAPDISDADTYNPLLQQAPTTGNFPPSCCPVWKGAHDWVSFEGKMWQESSDCSINAPF